VVKMERVVLNAVLKAKASLEKPIYRLDLRCERLCNASGPAMGGG
jgi:hypothetical protein